MAEPYYNNNARVAFDCFDRLGVMLFFTQKVTKRKGQRMKGSQVEVLSLLKHRDRWPFQTCGTDEVGTAPKRTQNRATYEM